MRQDLKSGCVFLDGAMCTMLTSLRKGCLKPGERPDILNITNPSLVESVHRMYVEAGSEIIITNTLGANAVALSETGYTPTEVITAAVSIAKRASGGVAKVALDLGPIGVLLEPMGDFEFDKAYELFKEQAIAGENAGADYAAIETMSDLTELKAAISAVTENTAMPVLATMTFDKTGHTYLGVTPEEFARTAERLGAYAVGLNCSLAPVEMSSTVERIAKATCLPMIIKPNAGLPDSVSGLYSLGPEEFAGQMAQLVMKVGNTACDSTAREANGSRRLLCIGGCCGTSPEYIKVLVSTIND